MNNGLEVGLNAVLRRFAEESDRREALDTKASLIQGFGGVLAGILFGALPDALGQQSLTSVEPWAVIILLLGFACIVVSVGISFSAVGIRAYRGGPGGKILVHASRTLLRAELEEKLLEAYASAYQHNWKKNQRKAALLQYGFLSIGIGTAFVLVALVGFLM